MLQVNKNISFKIEELSFHVDAFHDKYKLAPTYVALMNLFIPNDLCYYRWSNIRLHKEICYLSRRMVSNDRIFKAVTPCRAKIHIHSVNTFLPSTAFISSNNQIKECLYMKRYLDIILVWYKISTHSFHDDTADNLYATSFSQTGHLSGDFLKGHPAMIRWRWHPTASWKRVGRVEEPEPIILRSHWTFTAGGTTFVMYSRLARESCSKFVTAPRNRDLHKSFWRKLMFESLAKFIPTEKKLCTSFKLRISQKRSFLRICR